MKPADLPNFKAYSNAPYDLPGPTQRAWTLIGKCPKSEGNPRDYSNLVLMKNFPVEYLYPDGKAIQPDQIMVRFDAVGACASDIKIADQGNTHSRMQGRNLGEYPAIMGHEVALTVVAVGEALQKKCKVGERYVVNAETILDKNKVTFGYKYWGGYREHGVYGRLLLDNDYNGSLVPIGQDMSYLIAASLEPYACCYNTLDLHRPDTKTLKPKGFTWLMGAGPMSRAFLESTLSRQRTYYPQKLAVTEISKDRMQKFRETVGRIAENKGIEVAYIDANDNATMFSELDSFFGTSGSQNTLDDVFLMFDAPGKVLEPLVKGALDRINYNNGVFDVFAGLKKEVEIEYNGTEIPLKKIHYRQEGFEKGLELPSINIRIVGFSGLKSIHLAEGRDAFKDGRIAPYETMVAAVASLDRLPEVLHKVEDGSIDGKCIILPHAHPRLGFRNISDLATVLNFTNIDKGDEIKSQLQKGLMSDEATAVLYNQFIR